MPVLDKETFCAIVESQYQQQIIDHPDDHSIIETVMDVCDTESIDYTMVRPFINRSIKEKIQYEASQKGMLKVSHSTSNLMRFL